MRFNDPYWIVAVLVTAGLLVLTYFYYRRTVPPLKKPWRIGLGVIRSLALVLLLLTLAETLLSLSPEVADPPVAVGLIDASASMFNSEQDVNLYARAGRLWEQITDRLPPEVEAVRFFVAESLLISDAFPDLGGRATAVGTALTSLRSLFESKNLSAVFLFSDGNNNLGPEPSEAASVLGVPMITVGMGRPDTGLSPGVVAVNVDEVVLANRPFEVTVEATARRAGSIRLRLMRGKRKIDEQSVEISALGQRVQAVFRTSVPTAGIHQFRVEPVTRPEAGKSFFVKALKEKTAVLLFGFRPDWEFSFLRRTLEQIPGYEIAPVLRGADGRNLLENPPAGSAEWLAYDAIILVGPDERWLKSVWAPMAREVAAAGKGVMILLGENTFSRAAPGLPFPLQFIKDRPAWKRGEFPASVKPGSVRHPLLRLEENPDDSRRVFESFPPFAGLWDITSTLPKQATALLSYRPPGFNTPDYRTIPLVWTHREGGGKAVVVNGGPLWRWSFNSMAEPEGVDYFQRFLSYAIRWLTVTEDLEKRRIDTDKEIYASGEPVNLRGFLYDDGYRFLSRASVVVRVWPDTASESTDSATIYLPPGGGDFYAATLTGLRPGLYEFAGRAAIDNDTLTMAGGKFTVETAGLEKFSTGLDELQMRSIAEKSGGRYYHETEPIAVLDSLTFGSRSYTTRREIEIWNQPWVLIAILILLSSEWFIRKRRQLL